MTVVFLAGSASARAAPRGSLRTSIEPIIGYELVQKLEPTRRVNQRMMYGARATAGWSVFAGEAEYTRASDTEVLGVPSTTIRDTEDRLKLGVRGSVRVFGLLAGHLRTGVQARRNERESTVGGVTTNTRGEIEYDPYAGVGLTVGMGRHFALNAGVTVVFNDFPDLGRNDYQTQLGFSIRF